MIEDGRVTRSGLCVFRFKTAEQNTDGNLPDRPTSFVSFDVSSGKLRGVVRLVDADDGSRIHTWSRIDSEWLEGELFAVPTVGTSVGYVALDVRRMEEVYGPNVELQDRTDEWTERFEDVPTAASD